MCALHTTRRKRACKTEWLLDQSSPNFTRRRGVILTSVMECRRTEYRWVANFRRLASKIGYHGNTPNERMDEQTNVRDGQTARKHNAFADIVGRQEHKNTSSGVLRMHLSASSVLHYQLFSVTYRSSFTIRLRWKRLLPSGVGCGDALLWRRSWTGALTWCSAK